MLFQRTTSRGPYDNLVLDKVTSLGSGAHSEVWEVAVSLGTPSSVAATLTASPATDGADCPRVSSSSDTQDLYRLPHAATPPENSTGAAPAAAAACGGGVLPPPRLAAKVGASWEDFLQEAQTQQIPWSLDPAIVHHPDSAARFYAAQLRAFEAEAAALQSIPEGCGVVQCYGCGLLYPGSTVPAALQQAPQSGGSSSDGDGVASQRQCLGSKCDPPAAGAHHSSTSTSTSTSSRTNSDPWRVPAAAAAPAADAGWGNGGTPPSSSSAGSEVKHPQPQQHPCSNPSNSSSGNTCGSSSRQEGPGHARPCLLLELVPGGSLEQLLDHLVGTSGTTGSPQAPGGLDHPTSAEDGGLCMEDTAAVAAGTSLDTVDSTAVCLQPVLPPEETHHLVLDVAQALVAVHTHTLGAHRDVKSGNILVWSDAAGSLRGKLADFGCHKPAAAGASSSMGGNSRGTPGFTAPEVLYPDLHVCPLHGASGTQQQGQQQRQPDLENSALEAASADSSCCTCYSPLACDTWSFGCWLLELHYGRPPGWFLPSWQRSRKLQLAAECDDPGSPYHTLDPRTKELVKACLVAEPWARPLMSQLVQGHAYLLSCS
jgi:hypothetical protein